MKAALDHLKEHLKYLEEDLAADRRKRTEAEKSVAYWLKLESEKMLARSQVVAAIEKLEAS